MKLMIDIDEATYEYAKNNKSYLPLFYCEEVWRALSEGTPIPDNAKQDEAISTLKNTAWLGTEDDRAKVDEAIRILQSKQIPQCGDREYTLDEEYQTYDMAISALERQAEPQGEWISASSSEKPNKWIPVSERLPEDKTYVLTTIKVPNRIAHARSGWYEGGFFHNDNGDVWKATDMEVIAWMPLPKPYEPQERSE